MSDERPCTGDHCIHPGCAQDSADAQAYYCAEHYQVHRSDTVPVREYVRGAHDGLHEHPVLVVSQMDCADQFEYVRGYVVGDARRKAGGTCPAGRRPPAVPDWIISRQAFGAHIRPTRTEASQCTPVTVHVPDGAVDVLSRLILIYLNGLQAPWHLPDESSDSEVDPMGHVWRPTDLSGPLITMESFHCTACGSLWIVPDVELCCEPVPGASDG